MISAQTIRHNMKNCKVCQVELTQKNHRKACIVGNYYICRSCENARTRGRYNPEKEKIRAEKKYIKVQTEILDHLGRECSCCDIDDVKFLTIDHVNTDGAAERKSIYSGKDKRAPGGWERMYPVMKKQGFDKSKYQIMCYNCNMSRFYVGFCEHNVEQSDQCYFCAVLLIDKQFQYHISANISICKMCVFAIKDAKIDLSHKNSMLEVRRKVIEGYGGACAQCKDTHWSFLTIDHVSNNGNEHRKRRSAQYSIYLDVINSGFSAEYQLLCYNCNCAKEREMQRDKQRGTIITQSEIIL